jgi:FtsP/CotA-like multicopper oxidase with cupredoxin domain
MHLHSHNFFVSAQGTGMWDGTVTRPENPQRRDTQLLDVGNPYDPGNGESFIVLDFVADNPGVWPFHCHIAWDVSDRLYINIMVSFFKIGLPLIY